MRFIHTSQNAVAEATSFTDKTGWEHLLVVVKKTFGIPENEVPPPLLAPRPLAFQDEFVAEPGLSAPLYENDFAARKARCDVIFQAHAHAPHGRPTKHLEVLAQVGVMAKSIHVVGLRYWEKDLLLIRHSEPQPFLSMPLHYEYAFGGSVSYRKNGQTLHDTYAANPVGKGYSGRKDYPSLHGKKLPNLEIPGRALQRPDEQYPPVALSPVGRNFFPRHTFAGTYDQAWREHTAPLLPLDFDKHYFQCAPEDQQIPFPHGGESVTLLHMSPHRPKIAFALPPLRDMPIKVLRQDLTHVELPAMPDTMYFNVDEGWFSVVWRASLRLEHKGLHGIRAVVVGDICPAWWEEVRRGGVGCDGCDAFHPGDLPVGCPHKNGFPAQRPSKRGEFSTPDGESL